MSMEPHGKEACRQVKVTVATVSDTRTLEDDESGRIIIDLLGEKDHIITSRHLLKNIRGSIESFIFSVASAEKAEVLILTGGTGISPRDVTVDIVEKLLEKKIDGFGELFRHLSFQEIGTRAMMSRATAGLIGRLIVIAIPGSPHAARLAMERLILPELSHMAFEALKGSQMQ
ncbi:MAG: molybdenum cofactor biosynthesis protein B [Candidatus Eremiobacteraeota bacterium]|nr:molybdenum cofactor biosynthesis protein B [Candidatus Eremiobacteraeota bacterium]